MKEFMIDATIFALSFIVQSVLSNYIKLDNIVIDFVSFFVIFIVIYALFTPLRNRYKGNPSS